MIKRPLLFFLCVLLLMSTLALSALAHPGRTDQYGGHWDHSTGEYHYHGTPDSSHSGGSSSGNDTNRDWESSSSSSSGSSKSSNTGEIVGTVIACIVFAPVILICIFLPIGEKIKDFFSRKAQGVPPDTPPPQKSTQEAVDEKPNQTQAAPTIEKRTPPPKASQAPSCVAKPVPKPPLRGSEHDSLNKSSSVSASTRHTAPSKAVAAPPPVTKAPQPEPTPRPLSFANSIIAENPAVLKADPAYLTEAEVLAYAISLETPRGKKAVAEQFWIKNKKTDTTTTPHRASASIVSLNSSQEYNTTLVRCSCPDHRARHMPCKHMIALAISVNAITVDIEALKNRK